MNSYEKQTVESLRKALVGKKVTDVGYMKKEDQHDMGWSYRPLVICFEGDQFVFPMADDEGNEAGALATSVEGCGTVGVLR